MSFIGYFLILRIDKLIAQEQVRQSPSLGTMQVQRNNEINMDGMKCENGFCEDVSGNKYKIEYENSNDVTPTQIVNLGYKSIPLNTSSSPLVSRQEIPIDYSPFLRPQPEIIPYTPTQQVLAPYKIQHTFDSNIEMSLFDQNPSQTTTAPPNKKKKHHHNTKKKKSPKVVHKNSSKKPRKVMPKRKKHRPQFTKLLADHSMPGIKKPANITVETVSNDESSSDSYDSSVPDILPLTETETIENVKTETTNSCVKELPTSTVSVPSSTVTVQKDDLESTFKMGLVRSHSDGIIMADDARKSFIDMNINKAEVNKENYAKKLELVGKLYSGIHKKEYAIQNQINDTTGIVDSLKSKAKTARITAVNLQNDIDRGSTTIRLLENKIQILLKDLESEKNKLMLFKDKINIYKSRKEHFIEDAKESEDELKNELEKLNMYRRLKDETQNSVKLIREKLTALKRLRQEEINTQNILEIEKDGYEDKDHIPLFAQYI